VLDRKRRSDGRDVLFCDDVGGSAGPAAARLRLYMLTVLLFNSSAADPHAALYRADVPGAYRAGADRQTRGIT
jgi:hypothetical protein